MTNVLLHELQEVALKAGQADKQARIAARTALNEATRLRYAHQVALDAAIAAWDAWNVARVSEEKKEQT